MVLRVFVLAWPQATQNIRLLCGGHRRKGGCGPGSGEGWWFLGSHLLCGHPKDSVRLELERQIWKYEETGVPHGRRTAGTPEPAAPLYAMGLLKIGTGQSPADGAVTEPG